VSSGFSSKPKTVAPALKTQSSTPRFVPLACFLFPSRLYSPIITQYQTQSKFQAQRAGQVPPTVGPQPPARYPIPNGLPGAAPSLPTGQMNGIGHGGQPTHYGPANPPSQPNGIPGPPGPPGPPGQPYPAGMANRPPMGLQQRHPNGAPQYHSPTIAPSPQSQGGPQQPPAGSMGPLGPSPHMNRAAMPPPHGPQHPQGGSAHQTPTPAYQQLTRPHSSHDNPSQNHMNPHPSPAMSGRIPPGQERSHMDGSHGSLDADLASFPPEILLEARQHAGVGEREAQSLTAEEKVCNHPHPQVFFLTSWCWSCSTTSYSMLSGSSQAVHLITALGHPLEPTCMGHCKIGDLYHNRCNSSYPCSNNVVQRGIALLLVRRYAIFHQPSRAVHQLDWLIGLSARNAA
jgi:hypothetical protein